MGVRKGIFSHIDAPALIVAILIVVLGLVTMNTLSIVTSHRPTVFIQIIGFMISYCIGQKKPFFPVGAVLFNVHIV